MGSAGSANRRPGEREEVPDAASSDLCLRLAMVSLLGEVVAVEGVFDPGTLKGICLFVDYILRQGRMQCVSLHPPLSKNVTLSAKSSLILP